MHKYDRGDLPRSWWVRGTDLSPLAAHLISVMSRWVCEIWVMMGRKWRRICNVLVFASSLLIWLMENSVSCTHRRTFFELNGTGRNLSHWWTESCEIQVLPHLRTSSGCEVDGCLWLTIHIGPFSSGSAAALLPFICWTTSIGTYGTPSVEEGRLQVRKDLYHPDGGFIFIESEQSHFVSNLLLPKLSTPVPSRLN